MTITPSALQPGVALGNAAASVYTTPANGQAVVRRAVFTNRDTSPHTITVHRVPSAGAVANSNMLISARRLTPGESYVAVELTSMVLDAGDSIQAFADSAAVVNCFISGFTL